MLLLLFAWLFGEIITRDLKLINQEVLKTLTSLEALEPHHQIKVSKIF